MAKKNKYEKVSPETQEEAIKMARATQRPGQTKEQTKLIAQGIEKGINHYKKQQKSKARELNKKTNRTRQKEIPENLNGKINEVSSVEKSRLPWVLLAFSWVVFAAYIFLGFWGLDIF